MDTSFIEKLAFNSEGLIPVVAQRYDTGEMLMLAWMNRRAIEVTLESGDVTYWSRSRNELWRKGATSGHTQTLKEFYYDCDADTLLVKVDQKGVACHTGAPNCFFNRVV